MSTTSNKVININGSKPRGRRRNNNKKSSKNTTNSTAPTRKRKNTRKNRSNPYPSLPSMNMSKAALGGYLSTLTNPIEVGPVRVGFGTMVATELYSAYYRTTATANADGTFAVVLCPSMVNMISTNNAGAAVATWVQANATNTGVIANLIQEARIVSGGLSVLPQIAATAVPGTAFVATVSSTDITNINGYTINTMVANPAAKMGFARSGASGIILPVDPTSFTFSSNVVSGYPVGTLFNTSSVFIAFTGLPASATIQIEATLNMEGVRSDVQQSASATVSSKNEPTLADHFPSLDNLWATAKKFIPDPTRVNEGYSGFSKIAHTLYAANNAYQQRKQGYKNYPTDQWNRLYAVD